MHNSKHPMSSLFVNAEWPSLMPVRKVKSQLSTLHSEWSSCLLALQVHDCVVVDGARNLPKSQQDCGDGSGTEVLRSIHGLKKQFMEPHLPNLASAQAQQHHPKPVMQKLKQLPTSSRGLFSQFLLYV